jgi:glycine oxidase
VEGSRLNADVDLLIVGAGVIGLSCAWRAAESGLRVRVLERGQAGGGASGAAAGLLSPTNAVHWNGSSAAAVFAAMQERSTFYEQIADASGHDPGFRPDGSLRLAIDDGDEAWLQTIAAALRARSIEHVELEASGCRREEPGVRGARSGLLIPRDGRVDSGRLIAALRAAAESAGATISEGVEPVTACTHDHRLAGAILSDGSTQPAALVLVATGAWSSQSNWLPTELRPPVRPLAGEYMILEGAAPCRRVVLTPRGVVVPRTARQCWAGTTVRESGYDALPRAGALGVALRCAAEALPAVNELQVARVGVGLRPATPDGMPIIGPASLPGLAYATGHARDGIVLAPVTAGAVVAMAVGAPLPEHVAPFAPARLGL